MARGRIVTILSNIAPCGAKSRLGERCSRQRPFLVRHFGIRKLCFLMFLRNYPFMASRSRTLMVLRLRNNTTRMASPMADSAAATVRMKNTNTWPLMSWR
uniref:Uncharacterized protein n=1 Tax=Candidatus Kentrum sp. DK TaxID=2126562 RepID=A0A450T805_9GAMM|nr:MAG: hypothetical protein BECKDK2373C_GA0170839_11023 [Candidatus Kentron sp. DK]